MAKLTTLIRPLLIGKSITGLTGGGATNLDGIATVALTVGIWVEFVSTGGTHYIYRLKAGTEGESSPTIIRPDDYAGGTNEKVWELIATNVAGIELLTANRTYYVRADGNDANSGLADTAGGAFLTLAKAAEVVATKIIINAGVTVTIQVRDGTFASDVTFDQWLGGGEVVVNGNAVTPGNVDLSGHMICYAKNLTFQNCEISSGVHCISALKGAVVTIGAGMIFGAPQAGGAQLRAEDGGNILASVDYTIAGNADAHYRARRGGVIQTGPINVTISGAPSFTYFAEASHAATIESNATGYTGAVTAATRYHVSANAIIDTLAGGANFYPGTIAGVTATGGQYI